MARWESLLLSFVIMLWAIVGGFGLFLWDENDWPGAEALRRTGRPRSDDGADTLQNARLERCKR